MKPLLQLLCVVSIVLLSGCGTAPHVYSALDPESKLTATDPVKVLIPDTGTIAERRLGARVEAALTRKGVPVAKTDAAEYWLTYSEDEKTSSFTSVLPVPTSSSTTGNIGGIGYSQTTTGTAFVPVTKDVTIKKLYFSVYRREDVMNNRMRSAWEGYIGCEMELWRELPDAVLDTIFQYYLQERDEETGLLELDDE